MPCRVLADLEICAARGSILVDMGSTKARIMKKGSIWIYIIHVLVPEGREEAIEYSDIEEKRGRKIAAFGASCTIQLMNPDN